jgi:acyl carrier protein
MRSLVNDEQFLEKLAEILQVPAGSMSREFPLTEENWDSVAVLSAISLIDEQFDVTVDAGALQSAGTAGEVVELVRARKQGSS